MFREIKDIYCSTLTEKDSYWSRIMARPLAAVLIYFIKNTAIKPNQITIFSYFITVISGFVFVFWQTYGGLIAAVSIYQFAYILDGVDGQLARLQNTHSRIGYLLDTLYDGAKALIIVAAVSLRLFLIHQNSLYLILGITGILLVATSLMLTRFSRTEEYLKSFECIKNYQSQNSGKHSDKKACVFSKAFVQLTKEILEKVCKFLIDYPGYILYFALINKMEWFLYIYLGVYLLYTPRIFLSTTLIVSKS